MRVKKLPLLLSIFAFVLSLCVSVKGDAQTTRKINSVQTIVADMKPPHEGRPNGVPDSYDWVQGPRIGMGNDPNSKNFKAMIAWGQVYEDAKGNPATNTRVQIRDIKAYMLSKRDGKWHQLQNSRQIEGAAYREDFVENHSKPADVRKHSDGSISIKAGDGYNFHFWPATGRVSIDPKDIAGMFTTAQARLIVDNPQKPDDRAQARYLMNIGGDYWSDLAVQWNNQWTANSDIAMGKFKYVKNRWQAFNMTTLSEAELLRNPPPIN
jgi:hypothetical protein